MNPRRLWAQSSAPLLAALAALDLALGLGAIVAPGVVAAILWPEAGAGGLVLLRRTGAIWLFFAAAEVAALARPGDAARLRLVALLRFMDIPADALWAAFAAGLTPFGRAAIGLAPVCNLIFGVILWRAAGRRSS